MLKKIIFAILGIVIVFAGVTLYFTMSAKTKQPKAQQQNFKIDEDKAIKNLSTAVTFKTISQEKEKDINYEYFKEFQQFLKDTYPEIYKQLEYKEINDYSMIFKWSGKDSSKKPIGLTSHYDVVPVAKGTEVKWQEDAFSGAVDEKYIWGRGTLDDKVGVIGTLEAVDYLLKEGFVPPQDLYLFFGHDEENGGDAGAAEITKYFKNNMIQFEYIMDEGGAIVNNMVPGVEDPVGVIGVAEKGSATIMLSVEGSGGHSSQPKNKTTIGRLSAAIAALEEQQFTASIAGPTKELFEYTAPEMSFGYKYVFENQWLFKPIIKKILLGKPATAAVTRTTIAPTIFKAGDKGNILPEFAEAQINIRVMPGDTFNSLKKQVNAIIDDKHVKVTITGNEASAVSSSTSRGFKMIQQAAINTNDQTIIAPYIMIGASDSKHYSKISDDAYRFLPIEMEDDGLERMHGTNERVEKVAYMKAIQFYIDLMKQ
ncbi:M20/M25/M40 family metallo-hydrolase [Kurthia sibirica]|uniref:Peptidase M20 dimerisation domain-containing protein n=1 Tax=Kurthia sibirica TaxID=202750 RepID=A0A2U3AME0_9BACL|nr:M20/M25/M40 family metallo-hydrolase [Kurthia sibirica]PWI25698.1 hypothetical protein DEX24_07250 [Kurthia sibirica]GEK33703.1 peptidase M20 [Kurthia sibirica]